VSLAEAEVIYTIGLLMQISLEFIRLLPKFRTRRLWHENVDLRSTFSCRKYVRHIPVAVRDSLLSSGRRCLGVLPWWVTIVYACGPRKIREP
jgi:hypothetical protein